MNLKLQHNIMKLNRYRWLFLILILGGLCRVLKCTLKYSWFLAQTHTHLLYYLIIQHLGAIHNNLKWIKLNNINDVLNNWSWWLFILLFKYEMFVIERQDTHFMIENRGDCGVQEGIFTTNEIHLLYHVV